MVSLRLFQVFFLFPSPSTIKQITVVGKPAVARAVTSDILYMLEPLLD
jgi:hypothetical protein